MGKIKTRDVVKGMVKSIDKSAIAAERMKDTLVHTKQKAEHGLCSDENSLSEYASDNVMHTADRLVDEGVHQLNKQGQKTFEKTRRNIGKARQKIKTYQEQKNAEPVKQAYDLPQEQIKRQAQSLRYSANTTIKTAHHSEKTIKQSARANGKLIKQPAKGTVKTAHKSVKTAEQTAKTTIKSTQQITKAVGKAAANMKQAALATVNTAQKAEQAARAAAKASIAASKAAAKATVTTVKMIMAATKALISAIVAGGWVAIVIIIVICLIGLLVGSCFGIFFAGEESGTGQTMQTAVREINTDYQDKLNKIKGSVSYDVLEMSGSRAVWKEVLAIYSVKTTTDPDNAQEVATMDNSKKELLKNIFWQMNEISSRTEIKIETVIEETDDGHGNIVETETTVTRTYLYITVSHKTAEEMANEYSFSASQRKMLAELLADGNNSLWSAVLYGIGTGNGEIVTVALSQVGNVGGQPYWRWYGFGSRVEWCACFVSWCANECGYINAGVIPKFATCASQGVPWFRERGQWQDNGYEPQPGDIIFFDWASGGQDGLADHTGIVEKVEGGRVYTIEGNSGDTCRQNSYPIGYYEILGYGVPAY